MKKYFTSASPFLMLLIPVFLCIGLLIANKNGDLTNDNSASASFKLPSFQNVVRAIF